MKKKILIVLVLLIVFCGGIGLSYATWTINLEQLGENKIQSTCFRLSLTNEKNEIHLQNAYPILNSEGKKLTPYSFTITNTCDLFASFEVTLEILEENDMPIEYIASMVNNESIETLSEKESRIPTIQNAKDSRVLATGSLGSEDSEDYTLRLWMDEGVTLENQDSMNKNFKAKIVIVATPSVYNPIENGITKLGEVILANEYQTAPEIAKQKIHNKQAVDFTKTAPIIDWRENHGTSIVKRTYELPHPDKVGEYAGFTNINQSYMKLGRSYTFHQDTGSYDLEDVIIVDPTTITNYNSQDYYECNSATNIGLDDNVSGYSNDENCTDIRKVVNVTKENTIRVGPSGKEFQMVKYNIEGYLYTQVEFESDKSDKGLYEAEDDLGTSYYYRGSVKNNNVYFNRAYWQIIRINGDGSVRLLYNGTVADAQGGQKKIGKKAFNIIQNRPGYVGYKYGNIDGSTIEEIYTNENDSTMKTYLEEWYKTNIVDKNLEKYIADSGFCNDRTLSSQAENGDGIQTTGKNTYYGAYDRYRNLKAPTLQCPNLERDYFTTSTSEIGNKSLTYPIGLITVDELAYAGMSDNFMNKMSYVYSTDNYWTMSPSLFYAGAGAARGFPLYSTGLVNPWAAVSSSISVRPVINLKADVLITGGIGTANDPFMIKIE